MSIEIEVVAAGPPGPRGYTGNTGPTGPQGAKGDTGPQGAKGDTGNTGAKGDKGDTGNTGAKGDKGDKGDTGAKGDKGDTGPQGAKGDKGDQGDQGETGPTPDLSIGTVGTGAAAASLTGTSEAPVLNLTLPSAGANGVNTAAIQDGAVTSAKIADDTITAAQIAANAVGSSELADNAVDTAAIADSAVTAAKVSGGLPWTVASNLLSLSKQQCTGAFGTDAGWWASGSNLTAAIETDSGPDGTESAYVLTKTDSETATIYSHFYTQLVDVTALRDRQVSTVGWVNPSHDCTVNFRLQAPIDQYGPLTFCPAGQWTQVMNTFPVANDATSGRIYLAFSGVPNGGTLRFARATWSAGPHRNDADEGGLVIVPDVLDPMLPVACVIRSTSGTWEILTTNGHRPVNISSISQNATTITLSLTEAWKDTASVIVAPDELFAPTYRVGASVGLASIVITVWDNAGNVVNPGTISSESGNFWVYGTGWKF